MNRLYVLIQRLILVAPMMMAIGCHKRPNLEETRNPTVSESRNKSTEPRVPWTGMTIQIRHPENQSSGLIVRLDPDRLRSLKITPDDVVRALEPASLAHRQEPPPQPGVVFSWYLLTTEKAQEIVIRASPDGDVFRLRDVARVEYLTLPENEQTRTEQRKSSRCAWRSVLESRCCQL